jgi:hypothetical protein
MSDNLFDTFGEESYFPEEEEGATEVAEGEGQNRTFLIAVAVLGGLLVCAIGAFMVWALVINPRMQAQQQAAAGLPTPTEEATQIAGVEETPGVGETQPAAGAPSAATNTPKPEVTPTPVVGPTRTPTPTAEGGESGGTVAEAPTATPTPTTAPRRTPTPIPTNTPRPTPTPRSTRPSASGSEQPPNTGLGEVALVGGAVLLVGVFFLARRLRKA